MHHAYLYYGSLAELPALAEAARTRFRSKKEHDPDVEVRAYEKFGIDEARQLQSRASFKSISGRALYIVGVGQITTEAQQALLKLFEEPQEGLTFLLLAPHGSIIPTLRSRFLSYPIERRAPFGKHLAEAKHFLSASPKARSAEIATLLKDEEGLRERVREFLNGLEQNLFMSLSKAKDKKDIRESLEDIAKVRSYANDRSPSFKMLLEHLALSLPQLR